LWLLHPTQGEIRMSYGFTVEVERDTNLDDLVFAEYEKICEKNQIENGTNAESRRALESAIDCAFAIMSTFGDAWSKVRVTISGHSNPGQLAKGGWANPFLSVNVSIMEYK
jgi:hypothetical protein